MLIEKLKHIMKLTLCIQNFSTVHMSLLFFFALATQSTS
jgi:hypothetical protein